MPAIQIQVNGSTVSNGADIPPGGYNRRSLTFAETHGDIEIIANDGGAGGSFIAVTASYETTPNVSQLVPKTPAEYTIIQRNSDAGPVGTVFDPANAHFNEAYRIISLGNTDWNAAAGTTGKTYEAYEMLVNDGSFRVGAQYKIVNVGSTNWNAIGYVGTPAGGGTFTATGTGTSGTGGTATLVANNDTSVFVAGETPQVGTTGTVEAVTRNPVMVYASLPPLSVPGGPITYTPLGPNGIKISGKHVGGFDDKVTYVPDTDKISTPTTVSKIEMYGIGSAHVPAGSEIMYMDPDKTVERFKLNVTVAYVPNPLNPVTGPFSWYFYHPVYPWFDGPRDFMDAWYAGGPSQPAGDPTP